MKDDIQL